MRTRRSYLFFVITVLIISVVFLCARGSDGYARADEGFLGSGTEGDPYLIQNASDLTLLATLCNNATTDENGDFYSTKHYKLTDDIDLGGTQVTIGDSDSYIELGYVDITAFLASNSDLHAAWAVYKYNFYESDGENYFVTDDETFNNSSIYFYHSQESDKIVNKAFFGTFDGDGKTISNGSGVLFGCLRNAEIKNLVLDSFVVDGNSLFINSAVNSQIISCAVTNGVLTGTNNVGGVVGELSHASGYEISLPYASANGHKVTLNDEMLVPYLNAERQSEVKLCTSIGNTINGSDSVGGIVGHSYADTLIEDCFNSSSINALGGDNGGIAGSVEGSINKVMGVFSTNNVFATVGSLQLGSVDTLYYPSDFCIDAYATSSYRAIQLLNQDFVNTYLPNWTLLSAQGNKVFYPTPNPLSSYSENLYSITIDGGLVDYVRASSPTYVVSEPSQGAGYCYEMGGNTYYQNDVVEVSSDTHLRTALITPTLTINGKSTITYDGTLQEVGTATYTHELSLEAEYSWLYSQNNDVYSFKSDNQSLAVKDVSESGYYKCSITVSDGIRTKTVESEAILITVDKRTLKARSYSNVTSVDYDGNEHSVTYQYQYEGLVSGDEVIPIVDVQEIVNAGEYQLLFSINADNYNVEYSYGIFVVNKADISYDVSSYDGIYDGQEHGVRIGSIDTVDGCPYVISYSLNGVDFVDKIVRKDVSSTSVTVKISAPNHNDVVVEERISISASTVKIEVTQSDYPDITKVYDGTYVCDVSLIKPEYISITYDGEYQGVAPIVITHASFLKSTTTSRTNVIAYFALTDTKNFLLDTQSITFTGCSITPAEIKIVPKGALPSVSKIYDGSADYPINQLPDDTYEVVTDCPIKPSVGIYSAVFNSANVGEANTLRITFFVYSACYQFESGYNGFVLDAEITPKTITVSSITIEDRPYDGTKNVSVSDYVLSGVVAGDSVNMTYEQALSESENASEDMHSVTVSGLQLDNDNYVLAYSEGYSYVLIFKAEPTINPIVENIPLFTSSTVLPRISLSNNDTDGVIAWAEYTIDESGDIPYQWNFYSSSPNYNDKSGFITFNISDVLPVGITAVSNGGINEYVALSPFKANTIEVNLLYNDGSAILLDVMIDGHSGYVIEYENGGNRIIFGDTHVTVRYGEFSDIVDISVKKIEVAKPTAYGNYIYNGNEQTLAMSNFDTALVLAENNKRTSAGVTEVTIRLKDDVNYCFDDGSSSFVYLWTINPKSVSEPYLRDANSEYDGEVKDIEVVNPTQKTYYTTSGATSALNQGQYPITISLIDKVNYVWYSTNSADDIVLTYTVSSKQVVKPLIYNLPYVYDGREKSAVFDTSSAYEVSGDLTYVNAGTYTITATLNNIFEGEDLLHKNYVWEDGTSDSVTLIYQVERIVVSVPNINTRFEYSGKTHRLPLENNFYYKVSGSVAEINAGTYQAILTLSDDINFVWADGTIEDKVITYRILKKTVQIPSVLGNNVYSGYEMTALIPQSQYYTLIGNTATEVGKHTAKASLNNKLNYQWSDGTTNDINLVYEIVKRVIDIPSAPESLWYNGFPQVAHINSDDAYVVNGNTATDPGTYTATISLKDKDNYLWKDGTSEDVKYTYYVYSISFSEESTPILNNSFSTNSELYTPVKEGFNFAGWYDNPYYEGEKITAITNPQPNLILYAKWELIEYKEPINMDDGKKGGLGTNAILGLSIAGGALVIALLIIGVGFVLKRR